MLDLLPHHSGLFTSRLALPLEEGAQQKSTVEAEAAVHERGGELGPLVLRLLLPAGKVRLEVRRQAIAENLARALVVLAVDLPRYLMCKVLVILQGHVHVFSQGNGDQFGCSLLLIVEQGIEANPYHVILIHLLKGQK